MPTRYSWTLVSLGTPTSMEFSFAEALPASDRRLHLAQHREHVVEGRQILDGTAGLWCCNAGHARPRIVEAIARQAATMDFAPHFQMGSPLPFELAARLKELAPRPLDH